MRRLLLVVLFVSSCCFESYSQCALEQIPPSNASENTPNLPSGFKPGTTVEVYIQPNSSWNSTAIANIQAGVSSWSGTNNVTFQFVTTDPGAGTVTSPTMIITQQNMDPSTGGHLTYQYQNNNTNSLGYVTAATMNLNSLITNSTSLEEKSAHEVGHGMFLGDCSTCTLGVSVMASGDTMNGTAAASGPNSCDKQASVSDSTPEPPPPPPPPYCSGGSGGCCNFDLVRGGIAPMDRCTPILLDLSGDGFHLSNAVDGVIFDILADKHPRRISWPEQNIQNGWLVLDRNGNGIIDDATELFGNLTPQPPSDNPNGFAALAEYDKPESGGNGDGVIDERDAIYSKLRIWVDRNHNGISEPDELITLKDAGITAIDLNYRTLLKRDANGNLFRYKAGVRDSEHRNVRFCYDVLLTDRD